MKTVLLRIGMPAAAFLLAITFAFATEKAPAKQDAFVIGYIFQDGQCKTASRDCNNAAGPLCTQGAFQVYGMKLSNTVCTTELRHWQ